MIDFDNWTEVTEWIVHRGPFTLKVESMIVNFQRWEYRPSVRIGDKSIRDGGLFKTVEEAKRVAEDLARDLANELCT
jgi:hypothetical protein